MMSFDTVVIFLYKSKDTEKSRQSDIFTFVFARDINFLSAAITRTTMRNALTAREEN